MGCGFQYVFLSDMDYFGMKRDAETLGDAIDYSLLESHYVGSGCPAGGVDDYQRLRGPESGPSAGERFAPGLVDEPCGRELDIAGVESLCA